MNAIEARKRVEEAKMKRLMDTLEAVLSQIEEAADKEFDELWVYEWNISLKTALEELGYRTSMNGPSRPQNGPLALRVMW